MRQLLVTLAFCILACAKANTQNLQAQDSLNAQPVTTAVDAVTDFFVHFHNRDSLALNNSMVDGLVLRSLAVSKTKGKKLSATSAEDFIKSITSIPDSVSFEERLLEMNSFGNQHMTTVTATYEFYFNKKFSHNGSNTFTLAYIDDRWLIVGLADTRMYP